MGVFQSKLKLLCRALLFLIRLPRPVFSFIARLFGAMENNWFLKQNQGMGISHSLVNYFDHSEEYDSTWEDEHDHEDTTEFPEQSSCGSRRNTYAAKDMKHYRYYYQLTLSDDQTDEDLENDKDSLNVKFYRNKIPFDPDGVKIEEFYQKWSEDYERLEYVHSYIQWLFPIQEKGMNYASQELSLKEIKMFRSDEEVKRRLLQSYKIMLNFYGIELVSTETGEVKRAENWRARFENLNRNTHNNLRITRIIKCLGLLGFRHYQKPLVHFFLEECLVNGTLPRVKQSVLDYFMFAVLDKGERKELIKFAFVNFNPKEKFVWCPRWIHSKLLKEEETASQKLNSDANEGESSDSNSRTDQDDPMNSRVQTIDETKADTEEDTSIEKSFSNDSRNDKNASRACQDSGKQALPVVAAGNANTSENNEETEAPSGADSQHDGHIDSKDEAAVQKDDNEARNKKIPNSAQKATEISDENGNEDADPTKETKVPGGDNSITTHERTNENLTQTSNHSCTSENVANKTPLSGVNPGSEQKDHQTQGDETQGDETQGDKSEQGNKEEHKSQHTDRDSKENDSGEIQSGSESPEDSVTTGTETNNEANSAHHDTDKSVDKNSEKYSSSPKDDNTSGRCFNKQTSEQNSVSGKKIQTPESDNSVDSDQVDELLSGANATANLSTSPPNNAQSECGLIPHCAVEGIEKIQQPTLMKSPESGENVGNLDKRSEQQNQSDEMLNHLKAAEANEQANEKKDDPAHQSKEDTNEKGLQSHNNKNSDVKNCTESEQGTALRSDANSTQDIPVEDTETGEGRNAKSVEDDKTEFGCVKDGGIEKE